jgi:hypothetical protein
LIIILRHRILIQKEDEALAVAGKINNFIFWEIRNFSISPAINNKMIQCCFRGKMLRMFHRHTKRKKRWKRLRKNGKSKAFFYLYWFLHLSVCTFIRLKLLLREWKCALSWKALQSEAKRFPSKIDDSCERRLIQYWMCNAANNSHFKGKKLSNEQSASSWEVS